MYYWPARGATFNEKLTGLRQGLRRHFNVHKAAWAEDEQAQSLV
jgi:hypothetical protein